MDIRQARFVDEVTVTAPDSHLPVEISIYQDPLTGGLFGIDSSFIEQVLEEEDTVASPFGTHRLFLT